MKPKDIKNLPEPIKNRLRNVATGDKKDFNLLLQYYAMERLLFRVSRSKYSEQFVLKGLCFCMHWVES